MVLAARLDYKPNNKGSGDGWHMDSPFSNQFKAMCYLSDVRSVNGPFQILKGSHKTISALKALIFGFLVPGNIDLKKLI